VPSIVMASPDAA